MSTVPRTPARTTLEHRVRIWVAALLVLALAATGAVLLAGATVFGAAGFVRVYLDALARGDANGALSIPGVDPGTADPSLLRSAALAELRVLEVRELGESGGVHEIEARWISPAGAGSSLFRVERTGFSGLFASWAFASSPLGVLELRLEHDDRVRVNGLELRMGSVSERPHSLAVFVPGGYALRHESRWFTSAPVAVRAETPGRPVDAVVTVVANRELRAEVDAAARARLEECAEQRVLFPSGCPFGRFIGDRLASEPVWSIVDLPELEIVARGDEPRWRAGPAPGVARLVVEVRSIFDGSVEALEEDVPFELAFELRFGPGERLEIVSLDTLGG